MTTWNVRTTIGAIAVAAAIACGGGAAIAAATDTGFHAVSGGMRDGGPPGPPPSRRTDAARDALHGEYVVADDRGGFTTMIEQTGRVTTISPTSVTARSDDGFVQTYAIEKAGSASVPTFVVGDDVTITAIRKGETATVSTMRPPLVPGR